MFALTAAADYVSSNPQVPDHVGVQAAAPCTGYDAQQELNQEELVNQVFGDLLAGTPAGRAASAAAAEVAADSSTSSLIEDDIDDADDGDDTDQQSEMSGMGVESPALCADLSEGMRYHSFCAVRVHLVVVDYDSQGLTKRHTDCLAYCQVLLAHLLCRFVGTTRLPDHHHWLIEKRLLGSCICV